MVWGRGDGVGTNTDDISGDAVGGGPSDAAAKTDFSFM